ncbi:MAG: hypothetical protein ACJ0OL_04855 [Dehalococcoidia bacterium]
MERESSVNKLYPFLSFVLLTVFIACSSPDVADDESSPTSTIPVVEDSAKQSDGERSRKETDGSSGDRSGRYPEVKPANEFVPQKVIDRYPVWAENCTGSGPVMFTNSPMRIEDIKNLTPYGQVVGGHVTPIDHMYFEPKDRSLGRDVYEVRAIQDAIIFDLSSRDFNEANETKLREFRVDMAHTCTFSSYLDLLTSLTPELEKEWAKSEGGRTGPWKGISVKAGQLIGYIGAQTLDFGVYDYGIELPGFINPSAYAMREPWKIHTVDPFQYFPTEIREALLKKMIRDAEPRAGKIDYDVDGTISGNWFQQGTDWYNGIDQRKYWDGHLSVAPHEIDPTLWRIGVGSLDTEDNNFIIFGDQTPLEVNVNLEPVTYELRRYWVNIPAKPDKRWWQEPYDETDVYGVYIAPETVGYVLIALEDERLLRAEVFLGKAKEEILGFTSDARLYER